MTIEQALKIKQNWTAEQARNDLERLLLTDERPANKVIALACKALEKQIPKKVILGYDEQDYVCCPQCKSEIAPMDDDCLLYHCPGCGEKDAILQGDNYCFNCGQALDWSDTQ